MIIGLIYGILNLIVGTIMGLIALIIGFIQHTLFFFLY